ncbi:MAG: hypothetical protein L3K52_18020 [Candidatus Thiothrix sulfatifontis]|nr:MAG: hypothetical protein L3K52_18020 [Candidatus Thiothrix sulfatifontis]
MITPVLPPLLPENPATGAEMTGLARITLTKGANLVLSTAELNALIASGLVEINATEGTVTPAAGSAGAAFDAALNAVLVLGNTITLSAPNADVDLVDSLNADHTTTLGDDVINSTAANLVGSDVDGSNGSDRLVVTNTPAAALDLADIVNVEALTLQQGSAAPVSVFNGAGVTTSVGFGFASQVILGTGGQDLYWFYSVRCYLWRCCQQWRRCYLD